ncbi:RNA-binding protein [Listeria grandensis]|uniref:YlmH family RNA-binding protein n=1 Tax=Listeria grandensis TaxID=1494963 RepID=UPI00164DEF87|nr:RNA-binding protein [Listeria grandensis]MBC6314992.1 RNA-binding protein [Listeria grandensis]
MEGIYQHFRAEEHGFIDLALEWIVQVEDQYTPRLTDFLDPRQRHILESVVGGYEHIRVKFWGGVAHAERRRALIYPDYYEPTENDFQITLFDIRYPVKFTTLTHQMILGTVMSLGMKRDIFGDILTENELWQFFVMVEMKEYISLQLDKIGKVNIMLEEIPLSQALPVRADWDYESTTITSLRLDLVVATAHHISRQKAKQLVQGKLVKVNWKTVENPDFECEEKDIISARGYGRVKLGEINGHTKKDKIRMEIGYLR